MKIDRAAPTKSPRRGLTLLELILALVIFVGAAAALSRLVLLGLESAESAQFRAEATVMAENILAEYTAGIRTSSDSGSFPIDERPDWQATCTVEPMEATALYRVTIVITDPTATPADRFLLTLIGMFVDETELTEALTPAETETSTTSESSTSGSTTP